MRLTNPSETSDKSLCLTNVLSSTPNKVSLCVFFFPFFWINYLRRFSLKGMSHICIPVPSCHTVMAETLMRVVFVCFEIIKTQWEALPLACSCSVLSLSLSLSATPKVQRGGRRGAHSARGYINSHGPRTTDVLWCHPDLHHCVCRYRSDSDDPGCLHYILLHAVLTLCECVYISFLPARGTKTLSCFC